MPKGINKKSKEKEQKSQTPFRGSESPPLCGCDIYLHKERTR